MNMQSKQPPCCCTPQHIRKGRSTSNCCQEHRKTLQQCINMQIVPLLRHLPNTRKTRTNQVLLLASRSMDTYVTPSHDFGCKGCSYQNNQENSTATQGAAAAVKSKIDIETSTAGWHRVIPEVVLPESQKKGKKRKRKSNIYHRQTIPEVLLPERETGHNLACQTTSKHGKQSRHEPQKPIPKTKIKSPSPAPRVRRHLPPRRVLSAPAAVWMPPHKSAYSGRGRLVAPKGLTHRVRCTSGKAI